jgi:predicted phage terminase large subunit-like protein
MVAREFVANEMFQKMFNLSIEINQQDYWSLSNKSDYKAVGAQGGLTGFSADLIILDDLHKDAAEAKSQLIRDRIWDWLQSVVMTRRSPMASVILIGTRWHQDDVTGRILRQDGSRWQVLNLKALADNHDDLRRQPGEALWPSRYNAAWLEDTRKTTSRYHWSALYEGNPIPDEGNHVDITKFNHISINDVPAEDSGARWVRFWDLAVTVKKESDYTCGALCASDIQGNLYIIDIQRGTWTWPVTRNKITSIASIERKSTGVEETGLGVGLIQNLREFFPHNISMETLTPDKDKLTRALPWFAIVNSGKCFIVDGPWVTDFIDECQSFPLGAHDDQIDAVSGCAIMLKSAYMPMLFGNNYENNRLNNYTYRRSQELIS